MSFLKWLRSVVLVWLFLLPVHESAYADGPPVLPGVSDFAAMEVAETCSVLRAVLRHTESDYQQTAQQEVDYRQVVAQRQNELEACAVHHGLKFSPSSRAQALVAEVCAEPYEQWLHSGVHYRMLREDIGEAEHSLAQLLAHAKTRCAALPTT